MGFEINERIQVFIDALNVSPYEFSKTIGNKRPDGLYKILDKKTKPSPKTLDKIAESFPNLNMNWLINGEGNLLKEGRNRLVGGSEADTPGENKKIESQKRENEEDTSRPSNEPEVSYGDLKAIHADLKKDLKALAEGVTFNFGVLSKGMKRSLQGQQKLLDFIENLNSDEIKKAAHGLNEFLAEKEE